MLILSRWRAFIRARLYVHRLAIIVFDSRNRAQLIIVLVTLSIHWTRVERERMGIIDNVDASIDVEQFVLGRRPSRNARISRYCSLAFRYLHDITEALILFSMRDLLSIFQWNMTETEVYISAAKLIQMWNILCFFFQTLSYPKIFSWYDYGTNYENW